MAYSENGGVIDTTGYVTAGGYVTKKYLFDAYPQLSDQAKSAGLWLWGRNLYGGLGENTQTTKNSPVQTISGGANWKQIETGNYHTVAIKTDGTLWTWGYNQYGQLGDNTTTHKSSPVQTIVGGTNWKQVSSKSQTVAAIKTDGTLWLWGLGIVGQMGQNGSNSASSPVQTVSAGTNWKQVSVGGQVVSAIKNDGSLWLWGNNNYGQLGNNNSGGGVGSPVQTISGGTNWKLVNCSSYISAAIKTDGTLWLWGRNQYGQLGTNTLSNKSSPVQTIASGTNWKQVSCADYNMSAIKTDGTLWLWGKNQYGQLGTNNTTYYSSPVQTVAGGTNWKLTSSGVYFSGGIKTDGTLWLWGRNNYGGLGIGSVSDKSSPVQTIASGTNWKQVSIASSGLFAGAIKDFNEDF
jgi:alpha-tubulin suppressor-like RCC1 family protein